MPEDAFHHDVRRLRWTPDGRRLPASFTVATFDGLASARQECRERERAARKGVNPFSLGGPGLFPKTSLDAGRLHDWLLDQGIQHPPGETDWRLWCYNKYPVLDAPQQEAVWDALDKLRFFEVADRPARSAFAVMEFCWQVGVERDEGMPCDCEGGFVRRVFRTARAAEAARSVIEAAARDGERSGIADGATHGHYRVSRLTGKWPAGELSVDEVPLAETVEVPLMDDVTKSVAYLVQRKAMEPEGGFCTNYNGDPTEGVVPLSLHATHEAAEAEAARQEADAWRLVSPFAFAPSHHDLASLARLPYLQFRAGAQRLGLAPGAGKWKKPWANSKWDRYLPREWLALWDECVDDLTDAQRDGVWALLDRLRFHEVAEVALAD